MKKTKVLSSALAMGMVLISSISVFAATPSQEIIVKSNKLVNTSTMSKQTRMPLFGESIFTEGLYVTSWLNTTSGAEVPSGSDIPVPAGCYVTKAQAGITQGNASDYSKVVTDGSAEASLLNNPLQKQYSDNSWWYTR